MRKIAVVGFGCAAMNAISAMRECGCGDEIHVFSRDHTAPYNPMLTTYYASGKLPYKGLFPFGTVEEIQQKYDLHLHLDTEVTALDAQRLELSTAKGETFCADEILLATGANAIVPPLGVQAGKRVLCMRTVDDAVLLKQFLDTHPVKSALVIGASMVGVKIMELLWNRGVECYLSARRRVFSVSAFPSVSEMIHTRLRSAGIRLLIGTSPDRAIEESDRVISHFSDGSTLETDLLLPCIGTQAAADLARDAGLDVGKGIRVDVHMRTSHPHIYAAGDCAETVNLMSGSSGIIGLCANAGYQGRTAGREISGVEADFSGNLIHNITHFMGMDFISIGDVNAEGVHRSSTSTDGARYIEAVRDGDNLRCVNLLDSYSVSGVVRDYMLRRVSGDRTPLSPALRAMLAREGFDDGFLSVFEDGETK